ncbi:hypothetical protein HanXRQr2_Chr12g0546781 [Helianthus annuus]|uniref:Uncharacterized protein n=1 Tax=Helianthus annuus TaxID=4232 RepID=A0A9K3HHM4_HELAN|nr:hypothetical protein HanXRQr2_Chr12g0546781 [Helianthus annuus]
MQKGLAVANKNNLLFGLAHKRSSLLLLTLLRLNLAERYKDLTLENFYL